MDYALRLGRVLVLLALWRTILGSKPVTGGMTLEAVLTYTLVAEVFAEQLACRTDIAQSLWDGTMVAKLLQPMGIVSQLLANMLGRWAVGFGLFSLPLLLASPLLGVRPWPASTASAALFAVSLLLGISVGLALEMAFGALGVALQQPFWLIDSLHSAVGTLLSGALLPLALYPLGLGEVFGWLPFASLASAPLRIYTGTGDPLVLMLIQAAWSLVLWPFALWLWQANREKLVAHGG
jgi:ABC-2 type transport system permease protein